MKRLLQNLAWALGVLAILIIFRPQRSPPPPADAPIAVSPGLRLTPRDIRVTEARIDIADGIATVTARLENLAEVETLRQVTLRISGHECPAGAAGDPLLCPEVTAREVVLPTAIRPAESGQIEGSAVIPGAPGARGRLVWGMRIEAVAGGLDP